MMVGTGRGLVGRSVVMALILVSGCATGPQLGVYTGTCSDEFERCETHCANLKDDRECVLRCRFKARQCERDQGTERQYFDDNQRSMVSEYKAILIDLSGPSALASRGVSVRVRGKVKSGGGYHELEAGAQVELDIPLPNRIRQAELALTHGPAGLGHRCFISMSIDGKTVVGRYVPPRAKGKRLKWETWNLLTHLPEDREDTPKRIRVLIQNNAEKGSTEPYRISGVEVYYRTNK